MRRAILSLAACAVLAACGGGHADTERLREGLTAYRTGDGARLAELADVGEMAERRNPCSGAAYAESRKAASAVVLSRLSESPLPSLSEEARFAWLAQGGVRHTLSDLPRPLGCIERASWWTQVNDMSARRNLAAVYADELALWRRDLVERYGEQEFEQRMEVAMTTLRVNHVGQARRYSRFSSLSVTAVPHHDALKSRLMASGS